MRPSLYIYIFSSKGAACPVALLRFMENGLKCLIIFTFDRTVEAICTFHVMSHHVTIIIKQRREFQVSTTVGTRSI